MNSIYFALSLILSYFLSPLYLLKLANSILVLIKQFLIFLVFVFLLNDLNASLLF